MQKMIDAGNEGCWKGGRQERIESGKEGVRKGGIRKEGFRKGGIRERRDSQMSPTKRQLQAKTIIIS